MSLNDMTSLQRPHHEPSNGVLRFFRSFRCNCRCCVDASSLAIEVSILDSGHVTINMYTTFCLPLETTSIHVICLERRILLVIPSLVPFRGVWVD